MYIDILGCINIWCKNILLKVIMMKLWKSIILAIIIIVCIDY